MHHDACYSCWARSIPPPGCLWRLWMSASTLMQPFRLDGNVFCWCLVTSSLFLYISLTTFSNHDMKMTHSSSSSTSSIQYQGKQMIYQGQESQSRSLFDICILQCSSRWNFSIRQWASLATFQKHNLQPHLKTFLSFTTSESICHNSINSDVGVIRTFQVSGGV